MVEGLRTALPHISQFPPSIPIKKISGSIQALVILFQQASRPDLQSYFDLPLPLAPPTPHLGLPLTTILLAYTNSQPISMYTHSHMCLAYLNRNPSLLTLPYVFCCTKTSYRITTTVRGSVYHFKPLNTTRMSLDSS